MFEEAEDQEIRSFLGKFQIQNDDALKPMMLLSGGQKSRCAFAALAYKKPHVLIIDEGSNRKILNLGFCRKSRTTPSKAQYFSVCSFSRFIHGSGRRFG